MPVLDLHADYITHEPRARLFLGEFVHQFSTLLSTHRIGLGVPIEGRIKEWGSFSEKLERKELVIQNCKELPDFIGVRAITLFQRDVNRLCRLVEKTFQIKEKTDKAAELDKDHFGYLSQHFIVSLPKAWKKIPAFAGLDYTVELQVRTLSQHIWAAASHKLQYKRESDVPPEVARSIHRVAALLETVDLEFERVLDERESYKKSPKATAAETVLDIDNLKLVLDEALPPQNKSGNENYSVLLADLNAFGYTTVEQLRALIKRRRDSALEDDKKTVADRRKEGTHIGTTQQRIDAGVYFNHVGLARRLVRSEVGAAKWSAHHTAKTVVRSGDSPVKHEAPPKNE